MRSHGTVRDSHTTLHAKKSLKVLHQHPGHERGFLYSTDFLSSLKIFRQYAKLLMEAFGKMR